ncbi:hypothetical protein PMX22_21905 [Clostridium butyricum]|uniref:hypothetical protein n=1 Tax=Clostridium butyricum TaxID=1492 RepID=UPI00232E20E9|nr:hypothetical protein [Clostridium butyricum]MDB2162427.1 hypothetical protein [Clostridium butyricum]
MITTTYNRTVNMVFNTTLTFSKKITNNNGVDKTSYNVSLGYKPLNSIQRIIRNLQMFSTLCVLILIALSIYQ